MLEALKSIPERIIDVEAVEAFERLILDGGNALGFQPGTQRDEIRNQEGNVRLSRRNERVVNPEMQVQCGGREPHATAFRQVGRLWNLLQAEQMSVELHRSHFAVRWDRNEHVM